MQYTALVRTGINSINVNRTIVYSLQQEERWIVPAGIYYVMVPSRVRTSIPCNTKCLFHWTYFPLPVCLSPVSDGIYSMRHVFRMCPPGEGANGSFRHGHGLDLDWCESYPSYASCLYGPVHCRTAIIPVYWWFTGSPQQQWQSLLIWNDQRAYFLSVHLSACKGPSCVGSRKSREDKKIRGRPLLCAFLV